MTNEKTFPSGNEKDPMSAVGGGLPQFRSQPADRMSLEARLLEEEVISGAQQARARDKHALFSGHSTEVLWFEKTLRNHVPAAALGAGGLENPGISMTRAANRGDYDSLSDESYNELLRIVEDLAVLWGGNRNASGTEVMKNAMIRLIFEDDDLRRDVVARTKLRLQKSLFTIDALGASLFPKVAGD